MSDLNILLDWNTPFSEQKIRMLDQIVAAMYGGNNSEVSDFLI
jgi:hypothetical protein